MGGRLGDWAKVIWILGSFGLSGNRISALIPSKTLDEGAVIRVELSNGTIGEFRVDPSSDEESVFQWCRWASATEHADFETAVNECAVVLGGLVGWRQSQLRDVRYPQQHVHELRDFTRAELLKRVHEGSPQFESVSFASSTPHTLQKPSCNLMRDLPRQGKGTFGAVGPTLWRPSGGDGELSFMTDSGEAPPPEGGFVILLRLHERAILGADAYGSVESLRDPSFACLESLRGSLHSLPPEHAAVTRIDIFLNGFSSASRMANISAFISWFLVQKDPTSEEALRTVGKPLPPPAAAALLTVNVHTDSEKGNAPSFAHALAHLRSLQLSSSAVVFFLEDDALLTETALVEMLEVFHSHDPCFVTPIDSANSYTFGDGGCVEHKMQSGCGSTGGDNEEEEEDDDGDDPVQNLLSAPSFIVAGRRRHWRTVHSVTVTYAARQGTLDFFATQIPIPSDDYLRSLVLVRDFDASILAPLPTLAVASESLSDFTEPSFPLYVHHKWARDLYLQGKKGHTAFERETSGSSLI